MASTPFANLYYKRTVATPRACYVCYKPTPTVLSTAPVVDWIYTCDVHLSDPGFATLQAPATSPTPSASPEEIARIKEEWEAKQKKKQEEAEKNKEKKEGEEKKEEADEKAKVAPLKPVSPAPPTSGSSTPKHDKYVLHRQFYQMRLTDHRRQRQKKEVDALAPKLTSAGLSAPRQIG
ncbi:hypothetical protein RhiLY_00782 [Ceratobasidium sp. AG-Ba]|nr:hypothetical protein RhiLY_00782 [Ceratobasidium sp. AG-Ba]